MFNAPFPENDELARDAQETDDRFLVFMRNLVIGGFIAGFLGLCLILGFWSSSARAGHSEPAEHCREGWCIVRVEVLEVLAKAADAHEFAEHAGSLCGWSGFPKAER